MSHGLHTHKVNLVLLKKFYVVNSELLTLLLSISPQPGNTPNDSHRLSTSGSFDDKQKVKNIMYRTEIYTIYHI